MSDSTFPIVFHSDQQRAAEIVERMAFEAIDATIKDLGPVYDGEGQS